MSFKVNDRVKVVAPSHSMNGEMGNVTLVYSDGQAFSVLLDNGRESGFFLSELELVDEKREALIELAETLDKARLQANNINGCDGDIYRSITQPLSDVLEIIAADAETGHDIYSALLDGNTVRQAIAAVGV